MVIHSITGFVCLRFKPRSSRLEEEISLVFQTAFPVLFPHLLCTLFQVGHMKHEPNILITEYWLRNMYDKYLREQMWDRHSAVHECECFYITHTCSVHKHLHKHSQRCVFFVLPCLTCMPMTQISSARGKPSQMRCILDKITISSPRDILSRRRWSLKVKWIGEIVTLNVASVKTPFYRNHLCSTHINKVN